jgi:hypothetical protein
MRKILFGLFVAAMISSAATLMAANPKPCYAHSEDSAGLNYSVVWTNGGGHENHEADIFLGIFDTYQECLAAFDSI